MLSRSVHDLQGGFCPVGGRLGRGDQAPLEVAVRDVVEGDPVEVVGQVHGHLGKARFRPRGHDPHIQGEQLVPVADGNTVSGQSRQDRVQYPLRHTIDEVHEEDATVGPEEFSGNKSPRVQDTELQGP